MLTNLIKFIKLDRNTKKLFIEAFYYLGCARILIAIPFPKIAPSLGTYMQETPHTFDPSASRYANEILVAMRTLGPRTLWESKCLVQAIAAQKMLARRQVNSTLYLGTSRDGDGKLIAHAWLRSGPCFITGADVMNQFVVVGTFAKYADNR